MEQWHLARNQSPPDTPPSTSDTLRQVAVSSLEGMECRDADTSPALGFSFWVCRRAHD